MMRGDVAIGTLSLSRVEPGPFSDKQIAVLIKANKRRKNNKIFLPIRI